MTYTIYNITTGKIVRNVRCAESSIASQLLDEEAYVNGMFDANDFVIIDGQPVEQKHEQDISIAWLILRRDRDRRLAACDWTQVPDAPVDHQAWAVYRQQLRDLPNNTEDPRNPVWPTPPA
jgi:hypothetical protein